MGTTTKPRRIEYMPLDDLQPALRNAKGHDLDGIEGSATTLGWLEPQLLDDRTGRLVAGHGRLETLQRMRAAGKPAPEGIVARRDGTWLVPVVRGWSSADDDAAHAAGIGLNRWVEAGGWQHDTLVDMLGDLSEVDGLLAVAGFTEHEVADLLARHGPPPELDDLATTAGAPRPDDFWPVLRFRVSPEVRDRYLRLVEGMAGSDADLFTHLVDLAEGAAT